MKRPALNGADLAALGRVCRARKHDTHLIALRALIHEADPSPPIVHPNLRVPTFDESLEAFLTAWAAMCEAHGTPALTAQEALLSPASGTLAPLVCLGFPWALRSAQRLGAAIRSVQGKRDRHGRTIGRHGRTMAKTSWAVRGPAGPP